MPKTNVTVKLIGKDGNAFAIMGAVRGALKRNGHRDLASQYIEEATLVAEVYGPDYDHLLRVTMEYVNVE